MSALRAESLEEVDPRRSISRRQEFFVWVVLTVVTLVYSLAFIGHRPLADPDEGRYAAASWTMLQTGDWLVPHLSGRPHLTKSPASYWPSASGFALFGHNETGARAGVGLALALWILVVAVLARVVFNRLSAAVVAAATLATSSLPFVGGSIVTADPWLAVTCALAVTAGTIAVLRRDYRRAGVTCFWIFLGLAFFVKGPAGLLPLAGMVLAWPRRCDPSSSDRLWSSVGVLFGTAIGWWWYVAMAVSQPQALHVFLHDELYARMLSTELRRNGPPWLPLVMLMVGTVPWNLVLWSRWRAWRLVRDEPWLRMLCGWLGAGLLVFTLSRSRQPLYVLPLTTAVIVPAAGIIANWISPSRARQIWLGALVTVLALFWTTLRYDAARLPDYRHSRDLAELIITRRAQAPDGVAFLQTRLLPGLEFYLAEPVLHVAWKRADFDEPHDLDRAQLLTQLRNGRRLVVVGRSEMFSRFPADLKIIDRAHDRASDMDVALIAPAGPASFR